MDLIMIYEENLTFEQNRFLDVLEKWLEFGVSDMPDSEHVLAAGYVSQLDELDDDPF